AKGVGGWSQRGHIVRGQIQCENGVVVGRADVIDRSRQNAALLKRLQVQLPTPLRPGGTSKFTTLGTAGAEGHWLVLREMGSQRGNGNRINSRAGRRRDTTVRASRFQ